MKTKSMLLAVLISVIVLFGCVQVGNIPSGLTEKEYVCADGTTIVKNISQCPATALAPAAVEVDPEMKVCEEMPEIENMQFADYCYMGLAYKRENATLCKKLSQYNKVNCYSGLAALKEDVTICDGAGAQKSQCYSSYAMNKADISACDKITELGTKDNCYSSYASKVGDSTACDKIVTTGQKDNCYQNIASQRCDASLCNKIVNTNVKQQCTSNLQYCSGQQQGGQQSKPIQQ